MKKVKRKRKKRERELKNVHMHLRYLPETKQKEGRKEERRRQAFWPFQRTFILTRIFAFLLAWFDRLWNVVDVFGLVYPRNVYLLFLYCIVALFILFVFAWFCFVNVLLSLLFQDSRNKTEQNRVRSVMIRGLLLTCWSTNTKKNDRLLIISPSLPPSCQISGVENMYTLTHSLTRVWMKEWKKEWLLCSWRLQRVYKGREEESLA